MSLFTELNEMARSSFQAEPKLRARIRDLETERDKLQKELRDLEELLRDVYSAWFAWRAGDDISGVVRRVCAYLNEPLPESPMFPFDGMGE